MGTERLLLGNERLLLGNERLLLGIIGVFGFFWNFLFCCWGVSGSVGRGPRRGFENIYFSIKEYRNTTKKGRSRELREIHSGDPKQALWDDYPWRMRTAKVDMLGTALSVKRLKSDF